MRIIFNENEVLRILEEHTLTQFETVVSTAAGHIIADEDGCMKVVMDCSGAYGELPFVAKV